MKLRTLSLATVVLLAASSLYGQVREGTVEIEPFAGYLWGGRFARGSTALFSSSVDVEDHATYGGRLGVNATSLFEIEFHYSRTDTAFVTPQGGNVFGPGPRRLGDLRIEYYLGYATFNLGHSRVVPYVTVGAGAAHLKPNVEGADARSDTRFTASLGAGLKIFVNPHFGFRFDGRGYSTSLGDNNTSCGRHSCTNSNWLTNGEATGGLLVAF